MGNKPQSLSVLAPEFFNLQVERHTHPEKYRGYSTGFSYLDSLFGGWGHNWNVVIAAKSGKGKTTLLCTEVINFSLNSVSWLWCGLEEEEMEILERLYAAEAKVPRKFFRDIGLTDTEWDKVGTACDTISNWNAWVQYGATDVAEIDTYVKELKPQIVIVDYVQLLNGTPGHTMTQTVSESGKQLVRISKTHNVCTMIAAQENELGNVLWSQDIYRGAGVVLRIEDVLDSYQKPTPDRRKIAVSKSKYSGPGEFEAELNGDMGVFSRDKIYVKKDINQLATEFEHN